MSKKIQHFHFSNYTTNNFEVSSSSSSSDNNSIIFKTYQNRNEINQNLQNSPLNNNYPNIPSSSYNDLTFQPWRPPKTQDTF